MKNKCLDTSKSDLFNQWDSTTASKPLSSLHLSRAMLTTSVLAGFV